MSPTARSRAAVALLVLAGVFVVAASLAFWMRETALDSDRWAETVAPLPAEEPVAVALAEFTVAEVLGEDDLLALSGLLPDQFDALPGSASARLGGLAEGIAAEVVASPAFARVWTVANRSAHQAALAALDGDDAPALTADGAVVIDLSPVIGPLREDIAAAGIDLPPAAPNDGRLEILTIDERSAVAGLVRGLRDAAFLLPLVALVLIITAVLLHPRRMNAVAGAGVAVTAASLVTLAGLRVVLTEVRRETEAVDDGVVDAIGEVLTRGLVDQSLALAAVGGVIAMGAWTTAGLRGRSGPVVVAGRRETALLPWAGSAVVLVGLLVWPDPRLIPALGAAALAAAWWILARLLVDRSGERTSSTYR